MRRLAGSAKEFYFNLSPTMKDLISQHALACKIGYRLMMFQMKHLQLSLPPLMAMECILGFGVNASKYSKINNQMKFSHIDVLDLPPLSLSVVRGVLTG